MKSKLIALSLFLACIFITSCSNSSINSNINTDEISEAKEVLSETDLKDDELAKNEIKNKIDVELTALSSTMAYAEMYNMMINPDDYIGKTVKVRGVYFSYYYDVTDEYYHYVIIEDPTNCCQQGLEFILNGDSDYPDDESEIEIIGVFQSYDELGETYYYLAINDYLLVH